MVRAGIVLGFGCSWLAPVICSAEAPREPMVDGQLHATESAITDVEPGEFYRSGTRIGMTAGASFLIPQAWQGVLPPGSRTFYLESPQKPGIGLIAIIQDATPEELVDHLNEPQAIEEGYVLHPVGSATRTDTRITASYHSGDNIGRALAFFGPLDSGILILFTGPKEETAYYESLLEQIGASARFSASKQRPSDGRDGT
ncbi:MAG: hypothetical protein ABI945_07700 [Nitrospirales bacterium]